MTRRKFISIAAILAVPCLFFFFVRFSCTGDLDGIFLLRGRNGSLLEIKDDLFLGEGHRYIAGIDFLESKRFLSGLWGTPGETAGSRLTYEWNEATGVGYVRNHYADGRQMLTCMSRFVVDDGGRVDHGVFVGGGLPANVHADDMTGYNETGMAYYDGARWFHLWCNTNEALYSTMQFEPIYPSTWAFRGSSILHYDTDDLLIESRHSVSVDGVPLRIERYAYFRAGTPYFVLSLYLTNEGAKPVTFLYQYGDEPWLGEYGTSGGNVGWTADGLHLYAGRLEPGRYAYAGLFDYGNDATGEKHVFTNVANFLAWFGKERPTPFFSNGPQDIPRSGGVKVPLSGDARFIGLSWGPRTLRPDETVTYTLAIGMADRDPETGYPKLPPITLKYFP